MKFRVLVLLGVFLAGGAAYGECVNCNVGPCMVAYSDGTSRMFDEAPYCSVTPANDKGYENCRDVGDCRGCIGWSCVTRDPQTMEKAHLLALVSTEIIRAKTAVQSKH